MTNQEMFDKAWHGLKSQGWRRATGGDGLTCSYLTSDGRRCAWGWVDPEGTVVKGIACIGTVRSLRDENVGVAAELDYYQIRFAQDMQNTHDFAADDTLEAKMRDLAKQYNLTVPSGEV